MKEKVSKIHCPTLILCGEKDKANIKSANQLNKHIKNSECIFLEKAGHEINTEVPDHLATIIISFLNSQNNQ